MPVRLRLSGSSHFNFIPFLERLADDTFFRVNHPRHPSRLIPSCLLQMKKARASLPLPCTRTLAHPCLPPSIYSLSSRRRPRRQHCKLHRITPRTPATLRDHRTQCPTTPSEPFCPPIIALGVPDNVLADHPSTQPQLYQSASLPISLPPNPSIRNAAKPRKSNARIQADFIGIWLSSRSDRVRERSLFAERALLTG